MPWDGCHTRVLDDGGREFSVDDPALACITINYQARLQFGQAELVIETPFTLREDGNEQVLDPNDRAALGPLLALYPDTLSGPLVMNRTGTLSVLFESGASLEVPPHPDYEAWTICGFFCLPGGFVG